MEEKLEKYRKTIDLCSSIMKKIKAERMSNTKMGKYVNVFSLWNEFSGISEPIHSRILHFFPVGQSDAWTRQIILVRVFGVYWL